jgi:hypothetical protein
MGSTFNATIQGAQRLRNSPDGCPHYRVFTMNGAYLTKGNAHVNFDITNHIGKAVRITLDDNGHIIAVSRME